MFLGENTKGWELSEHIATKVEVNLRMNSILKNAKSFWSMNPGANVETSVVGNLVVLVALFNRKRGQGYSKSEIFVGRPFMSPFILIRLSLAIKPRPKRWWISCERLCFERPHTVAITVSLFLIGFNLIFFLWR